MKLALIGGVSSTLETMKALHENGFVNVEVFGYEPKSTLNVSCFTY